MVLSTGLAGCLGGDDESGPQEPVVESINVETSPQIRVVPQVRNPTNERVERQVWVRVASDDGGTLVTESQNVNIPAGESAPVPFIYDNVAWSGTDVDTDNTEARITATDAESPF
jgi:hypothetical protein